MFWRLAFARGVWLDGKIALARLFYKDLAKPWLLSTHRSWAISSLSFDLLSVNLLSCLINVSMRFDFTHGVLGKHFLILLVRFLEELGRCSSPVRLLKILQRHLSLFLISKQVESLF